MGAFKLGKMTFGSLFKKPETVLYPIEKKPQPMGLKGHIVIDGPACILCGMCDRSCTTNCISVDKQGGTWSIDRLQCVQCGYCITVCPKKCLSMDPNYASATTVHERDVVQVQAQEKPASKAPDEVEQKPETKPEPKPESKPVMARVPNEDKQVETLLGLMEPAKAEKVKEALGV